MKFRKYFVRFLETNESCVCTSFQVMELISDYSYYPLRIVPLDSNGELVHEREFLVGDEYSLSFLFNSKYF